MLKFIIHDQLITYLGYELPKYLSLKFFLFLFICSTSKQLYFQNMYDLFFKYIIGMFETN